ncbi:MULTISPECIES: hypothetical protein [Bradyrhizobium]|uniref:Uncharacterized protein n=2 Tax=Bradyrhizobium TaxID=374 RepID=A0ABY0P7V8_9BRAD|nr:MULTISPECIES: hypothetical protein [Bradyrhizobium]SDH62803.1 hypothetical protein SAMN05444163_0583 [Bradyrhizobium ottawaense]SEE19003.1 hypothetical protein SAMN05444171_6585 [Bradyrhizobium lablabi]SHM14939.1 hypothetical protein SAMN05444321_5387 [Bradyrhizobium lablabi]
MLHIDIPTLEEFKALAQIKGEVCISVYLPVSPLVQNIRANRIAFRDLAREALAQLREAGADKRKIAVFEERFDHLAGLEHDVQDEDKIRKRSARSQTRSIRSSTIRRMGWRCSRPPA